VGTLLAVIQCYGLQSITEKGDLDDFASHRIELQVLDRVLLSDEMRRIRILAAIRPEDVTINAFLPVRNDYRAVTDLQTCCAGPPSHDTQERAGKVAHLPPNRLGLILNYALNGSDPEPSGLSRDLLYVLCSAQMLVYQAGKR
jgi:hypothetical protein